MFGLTLHSGTTATKCELVVAGGGSNLFPADFQFDSCSCWSVQCRGGEGRAAVASTLPHHIPSTGDRCSAVPVPALVVIVVMVSLHPTSDRWVKWSNGLHLILSFLCSLLLLLDKSMVLRWMVVGIFTSCFTCADLVPVVMCRICLRVPRPLSLDSSIYFPLWHAFFAEFSAHSCSNVIKTFFFARRSRKSIIIGARCEPLIVFKVRCFLCVPPL